MKNRIIQSLVEYNNAVFWQTKDQTVATENTPHKNAVSNLEEIGSAHTILAGTPNIKEDIRKMFQKHQRTIHQKMLMTFILTIPMQSIGTPSQTTITVFQTLFQTVFQIIASELTSWSVITSQTTTAMQL